MAGVVIPTVEEVLEVADTLRFVYGYLHASDVLDALSDLNEIVDTPLTAKVVKALQILGYDLVEHPIVDLVLLDKTNA